MPYSIENNPIKAVNGVEGAVPCPSMDGYTVNIYDVSSEDAGRTEDFQMHKLRGGQCVTLELAWNNLSISEISNILKTFNAEYYTITYLNPLTADYVTETFYTGDRLSPTYSVVLNVWSVSFTAIGRDAHVVDEETGLWTT
jgi:hypothetical protein